MEQSPHQHDILPFVADDSKTRAPGQSLPLLSLATTTPTEQSAPLVVKPPLASTSTKRTNRFLPGVILGLIWLGCAGFGVDLGILGGADRNNCNSVLVRDSKIQAPLTHPQWCPKAKCHNTALCKPCQRRFLIVITFPRCASTTLTWMLDSLPGITMSGENNDALGKIRHMQDGTIKEKPLAGKKNNRDPQASTPLGPWSHHAFVDQGFSCISQDMIRYLNPPFLQNTDPQHFVDPEMEAQEIVGFKTIRFFSSTDKNDEEKEQELADWLMENFPCSKVLLNVNSDVEAEVASLEKTFGSSTNTEKVQARLDQVLRFASLLGPDKAYVIDKVQWTGGDMKYINDAVRWLGFHKSCQFEELLEYNTQGKGYGAGKTEVKPWPDTCQPL